MPKWIDIIILHVVIFRMARAPFLVGNIQRHDRTQTPPVRCSLLAGGSRSSLDPGVARGRCHRSLVRAIMGTIACGK